jgi:antigen 43
MTTYIWTGPASGGSFTNTANWNPTGYPQYGGDIAQFNTSVALNLSSSLNIGGIQVGSSASSLATLTLTGSGQTLSLNQITVYPGSTLDLQVNSTISTTLQGGGTINVDGVTLNGGSSNITTSTNFIISNGGTLYVQDPKDAGGIAFGAGTGNILEIPFNPSGGATVNTPITGVAIGDKIILASAGGNSDVIQSITNVSGNVYAITLNKGNSVNIVLSNVTLAPGVTATISGNVLSFVAGSPCFLEGTLIATPAGQVAVETIKIGDLVTTLAGGQHVTKPVIWVGHRAVKPGELMPDEAHPIRIKAGAFAENIPARDLLVTAEHCIFADGGLIPARLLVNGRSIITDTGISSFTYYHVELEQHGILLAEGLATESYLDTGNRGAFANAGVVALHPRLAGNGGWDRAAAPLSVAPEQVRPVWAMLNARAEGLGLKQVSAPAMLTQDPDLRIVTGGGTELLPVRQYDDRYVFVVPAGETGLNLVSRSARPSETVGPFIDDRRTLGVLVGEISLHEGRRKTTLRTHLTAQALPGWYGLERAAHRWTDGKASLPVDLTKLRGPAVILEIQVVQAGPYRLAEPAAVAA